MWGGVFGGVVTGWLITQTSWTTAFVLAACLVLASGAVALFLSPPAANRAK